MKIYILIAGTLLASTISFAQVKEAEIDSVNITGRTKIKKERAEFTRHAQSTEILSSYELNRNNPNAIEQSLGTLAGVQVDKRTNYGGQRVVVRGYGNDQKFNNWGVKFYLNSVPFTNADGVTNLEDIDFSLINNVEVIKGPAATLYGGGVGGVVRLYMRPETQKGVKISQKTAFGSFKTFQSSTRVDAVTDKSSIMFNYGHLESDGYRPRGNTNKNNYAFLGNFQLNTKQELSVYASHNSSYEGVTGQISFDDYYAGRNPENMAYALKHSRNEFDVSRATISHKWNIVSNITNFTSIFFTQIDGKRISAGALENAQSPNYGFRTTFFIKNKISENFRNTIEAGAEYLKSRSLISNYRFTGTNINEPLELMDIKKGGSYFRYNNDQLSIFATDKLTYEPWNLSLLLGVSANKLGYIREDLLANPGLIPGYNKDLSINKKFSTVYKLHIALQKTFRNQIFNLSYSEGYNAPTAATAFISGINATNDHLKPENAKMWDFSMQGLLLNTKFDYQISFFDLRIKDKLTQLSAISDKGIPYTYWTNTGNQKNLGFEASLGYKHEKAENFIKRIEPFFNFSYYDFRYQDFSTRINGSERDYAHYQVVGVPRTKLSLGLDLESKCGVYLYNTFNYLGDVYTNFENSIKVKGYHQLNTKIGYKHSFGHWDLDAYIAGNNITSQLNYTFLFLGNNVGDKDTVNNVASTIATDITPGPSKAYFLYGLNIAYRF